MKIVTDCAADLSAEEIATLDIEVAPLFIQFPEGEINSADIAPDEFYRRMEQMQPEIPTTAQPSPGIFAELYEKVAKKGEEMLSIHISSGLSGTIESARLGAKQMVEGLVNVVDSMTLSGGQRFQVLAAAMAAKNGWQKTAILERLQAIREATEVVYALDTLKYLARGGRIGRVQALAGALLNLKPVIHVDKMDGKYTTVSKARTMKRALGEIASHLENLYGSEEPLWVSVMHGKAPEQAEALANLLKQRLNIAKAEVLRISPVLGVHSGPGIVGATVVPMRLMDVPTR